MIGFNHIRTRIFVYFVVIIILIGVIGSFSISQIIQNKETVIKKIIVLESSHALARYMEETFSVMYEYISKNNFLELEILRSKYAIASYNSNFYLSSLKVNGIDPYSIYIIENYFKLSFENLKDIIFIHDMYSEVDDKHVGPNAQEEELINEIKSEHERIKTYLDYVNSEARNELNIALENYEETRQNVIILFLLSSIIILIISAFIAKSISDPLRVLTKRVEKVSQGDLNLDFKVYHKDEVGKLAIAFKDMIKSLKKSRRELVLRHEKQQALNKKLVKLNAIKDEFLSNVSHELKTPLTSIKSYCEILIDDIQGRTNKEQKKSLNIIYSSADTLLELINGLLDLRRIESGKQKFIFNKTKIDNLLNEVLMEFKGEFEKQKINLNVKLVKSTIIADGDSLKQVFRNIISNAIKYRTKKKLSLEIIMILKQKYVTITFKDNGRGISGNEKKKIFDKFYQVDSSFEKKTTGTGLGLAISEAILKKHKGKIEVKSKIGKGSSFIIKLPKKLNF